MSKTRGRIDLAKFREVHKEQRERAKAGPEGYTLVQRAVIRLIEDQLKEARVGEYTIQCDEAKSRKEGARPHRRSSISSRPWDFECSAN